MNNNLTLNSYPANVENMVSS